MPYSSTFLGDRKQLFSSHSRSHNSPGPSRLRYGHGYGERSRNGYVRSHDMNSTTITAIGRASYHASADDSMELKEGIQKTTEVHVLGGRKSSSVNEGHPIEDADERSSQETSCPIPIQQV